MFHQAPIFESVTYPGGSSPAAVRTATTSLAGLVEHMRRARSWGASGGGGGPANPYASIVTVAACAKVKANALASMPLVVSTAADEVIESGPLCELIARPNRRDTGRRFWFSTSITLDLHGRVHWRIVRDLGGRPQSVRVLSPQSTRPDIDRSTGDVIAWWYRAPGAPSAIEERLVEGVDVHTIIDADFGSVNRPWEGVGIRAIASKAIAQVHHADLANISSLANGVTPGGAFTMQGMPTPDQVSDIRRELEERAGSPNRQRPLVLYGGMEWEQMAASFTDMEFSLLKSMSIEDICAAFGVPPSVIGHNKDSNYGFADAAQRGFWIQTVVPLGTMLADEFALAIVAGFEGDVSLAMRDALRRPAERRQTCGATYRAARADARAGGRKYFVWFDGSAVPALQAAQLELAKSAREFITAGVPLNDVIRAADLPYPEHPWGETWWMQFGLLDVQDSSGGISFDDPDGAPPPEDGEQDEEAAQNAGHRTHHRHCGGHFRGRGRGRGRSELDAMPPEVRKATERTLAQIWAKWRASWMSIERESKKRLETHWRQLRKETLKNLEEALGPEDAPPTKAIEPDRVRNVIGTVLFDIIKAREGLLVKVGPLMRTATRLGGEQTMLEAAQAKGEEKPKPFDMGDAEVAQAIRRRELQLAGVNNTVRRRIAQTLEEGITKNEPVSALAERIRKEFNFAFTRAATIARTEVGAAVEEARSVGRRQAGVPSKSWLWSRKETGRPGHQETEDATLEAPIPSDALFTLSRTGAQTPHPRGPGLGAEDVVNCGCTTLSRFEGDDVRSVIARHATRGFLTHNDLCRRDAQTP